MNEVTRYTSNRLGIMPHLEGEFVEFENYDTLRKENDALKKQVEDLKWEKSGVVHHYEDQLKQAVVLIKEMSTGEADEFDAEDFINKL